MPTKVAYQVTPFPAAIDERPPAASASVSIQTMFCLVEMPRDHVLLPAPFGPQIMYRSGTTMVSGGNAMLWVWRAGGVMVLDGPIRVSDDESPLLVIVTQGTAVFQILLKDIRLVFHGGFNKFQQAWRHGFLRDAFPRHTPRT